MQDVDSFTVIHSNMYCLLYDPEIDIVSLTFHHLLCFHWLLLKDNKLDSV